MLCQLYIENVAVIEKAIIDFTNGFNVFTGETGAGKSILIDALSGVLGVRTSKDIVRTGKDRAYIRAVFDAISTSCIEALKNLDIPFNPSEPLIMSREITSDGKTYCKINSASCNVSALNIVGSTLVDIHSQHDNQKLLNCENHLEYIDKFAGIEAELGYYKSIFKQMCRIINEINELSKNENEKSNQIQTLKQTIVELEEANIDLDEENALKQEQKLLQNSELIAKALTIADGALTGEDEDGVLERVSVAMESLAKIEQIIPDFARVTEIFEDVICKIDDIKGQINAQLRDMEYSPTRLDEVETRLDEYYRLKQKYTATTEGLTDIYQRSLESLENIKLSYQKIESLKKEYESISKQVRVKAEDISKKRKQAGEDFCKKIKEELEFLNMQGTEFIVKAEKTNLSKKGIDKLEFLISANAGENAKPLAKIASGGELSRIMLAFKNVLSQCDCVETMIFDEIDTGISGKAAQKVGIKLKETAAYKQIICVTHLAQIACYSDNHLLIEKQVQNAKTFTKITNLDYEKRVNELARIISGENITSATLQTAKDMLKAAKQGEKNGFN